MLKRLRRRSSALLLATVLPASLAVAACGSDSDDLKGFDAFSISGEVGSAATVDWKGRLAPGKAITKVLHEGDGEAIADGDQLLVEFTLYNGYTHDVDYDTYDAYTVAAPVTVGAKEPQTALDVLTAGFSKQIEPGQRIGTRIAVTVGSDELLGDYLGSADVQNLAVSLNIGNEDGLLFVADLAGFVKPSGKAAKAPAWAPAITEEGGVPTKLDFKGVPAPSGKLRFTTLVEGTGPEVTRGQQILANYLGQTPRGKTPFDESYSSGVPFVAVVGGKSASVVKGWSQALVGQKVGSRILIEIPPSLGYGKEKQTDDQGNVTIPANSTLYFVVDILDAADVEPPAPVETPAATDSAATDSAATDPASQSATDPASGASTASSEPAAN